MRANRKLAETETVSHTPGISARRASFSGKHKDILKLVE
jgi:hypothetical protein